MKHKAEQGEEGGGGSGVVNTEKNVTSANTEFLAPLTASGTFTLEMENSVFVPASSTKEDQDRPEPELDPHACTYLQQLGSVFSVVSVFFLTLASRACVLTLAFLRMLFFTFGAKTSVFNIRMLRRSGSNLERRSALGGTSGEMAFPPRTSHRFGALPS